MAYRYEIERAHLDGKSRLVAADGQCGLARLVDLVPDEGVWKTIVYRLGALVCPSSAQSPCYSVLTGCSVDFSLHWAVLTKKYSAILRT